MKKAIYLISIVFLLQGIKSNGQSINLSMDSITTLLCKKWEVDYAIMGNEKIGRGPGAPEINYEFKKDKTYLATTNDPKDNIKGTWSYDAKKKIIKLIEKGKTNMSIISLKQGELVMLADLSDVTPDDPMAIKLVYKIKE
jgi:hypothetical protein